MSGRTLWLLFVAAALLALLLSLPLRVAAPLLRISPPLAAAGADGTVWRGQLREARWDRHALGTLSLRLSPWRLALGEVRVDAAGPELGATLVHGRRHGVEGLRGTFDARHSGLPLRLHFEDAGAMFDRGGCRLATGTVAIELNGLPAAGGLAPVLRATPRCDGVEWLAEFPADTTSAARLGGELRLRADGGYRFQVQVGTTDPVLRLALAMHGFEPAADGLSLVTEGSWWPASR